MFGYVITAQSFLSSKAIHIYQKGKCFTRSNLNIRLKIQILQKKKCHSEIFQWDPLGDKDNITKKNRLKKYENLAPGIVVAQYFQLF